VFWAHRIVGILAFQATAFPLLLSAFSFSALLQVTLNSTLYGRNCSLSRGCIVPARSSNGDKIVSVLRRPNGVRILGGSNL
jgi:hypothetical protein